MSGIVGIVHSDGQPVDQASLRRMADRLAHRGPDGKGIWVASSVGLGHRMLRTTPESLHEKLPWVDAATGLAITADARIDNRDELFAILKFGGRRKEEIPDSQLILATYERWGERCPERLLGDFAFAVWDERRQVLFCARDSFGVKPFFYFSSPQGFFFGSEIKAILTLPGVPWGLNELRVADYFEQDLDDQAVTFYQGILRLPPGHSISLRQGKMSLRSCGAMDLPSELRLDTDDEYGQAFLETFTKAVRCRLRSAGPVGAELSGGLDSSSVVCVAEGLLAKRGPHRLETFTTLFDHPPGSKERLFIGAVLSQSKLFDPHFEHLDRGSPLVQLDRILSYVDEPPSIPNIHWGLYSSAREHGVRVLLDGVDGDSVVWHGFERSPGLLHSRGWKSLVSQILSRGQSPYRYTLDILVSHSIHGLWRRLRGVQGSAARSETILHPDLARRVGVNKRNAVAGIGRSEGGPGWRQNHYRRVTSARIVLALEELDRLAALNSIELRHPFFDRRLVEFCLALPLEQRLDQGWTRVVLRRAMEQILPREVLRQSRKGTFAANIVRSMLTHEKRRLDELILFDPRPIQFYVDMRALQKVYARYTSRKRLQDAADVWDAASLAWWLRRTGLDA